MKQAYSLAAFRKKVAFLVFCFIASYGLAQEVSQFIGEASWYGSQYVGSLTANGEVFDPQRLTAAHATLPFNSMVRITNLDTGQSVEVRINDRISADAKRIIHVSEKAARAIGLMGAGVAQVRLEPLPYQATPSVPGYPNQQLYAYTRPLTADTLLPMSYIRPLSNQGVTPDLQPSTNNAPLLP